MLYIPRIFNLTSVQANLARHSPQWVKSCLGLEKAKKAKLAHVFEKCDDKNVKQFEIHGQLALITSKAMHNLAI